MTGDLGTALIAGVSALGGVSLGALLHRRNEKRAHGERQLVDALNDVIRAIAEVTQGGGHEALRNYAASIPRVALYASPQVVAVFRRFQDDANTGTADGRARLVDAVQAARLEIGQKPANPADLYVLFFGPDRPPGLTQ